MATVGSRSWEYCVYGEKKYRQQFEGFHVVSWADCGTQIDILEVEVCQSIRARVGSDASNVSTEQLHGYAPCSAPRHSRLKRRSLCALAGYTLCETTCQPTARQMLLQQLSLGLVINGMNRCAERSYTLLRGPYLPASSPLSQPSYLSCTASLCSASLCLYFAHGTSFGGHRRRRVGRRRLLL